MKEATADRLDSDVIRQGLLSIRNSQIELLIELKNETQQLKKTPLRFAASTEDSKSDPPSKADHLFSFPPENAESVVRHNPHSPSVEKPFSFGFRQAEPEVGYLKDENKMLNETLQKLLYSRSLDKERVRELESYLYFSSKIHLQLYNQLLNEAPIADIRRGFENDLRLNDDVYGKYQESNHQLVLQLLHQREADQQPFRLGTTPSNEKEQQISSQLGELKDQLVMLLKTNNQKAETVANSEKENAHFRNHNEVLTRKCEELQRRVVKLESDNKELALCWEREIGERRGLTAEFERVKKSTGINSDRETHLAFLQKDLETKLNGAHQKLKEKEQAEAGQRGRLNKLADTVSQLKEENDRLRREIKSIEEMRSQKQREEAHRQGEEGQRQREEGQRLKEEGQGLKEEVQRQREEMSSSRNREQELVGRLSQQGQMLQRYEHEIHELRTHLVQTRQNLDMMAQMHAKQRQAEASNNEQQQKKVHAIRTNSTVEHLWQVKRIEYENINELMQELRDKGKRI